MVRLELPDNFLDSGLALPGSTPKTLIQVDNENLPYACQCPCCGSIFNIPEGLLYKIEEDSLLDGDLSSEDAEGSAKRDVELNIGDDEFEDIAPKLSSSEPEVGESNDTFV